MSVLYKHRIRHAPIVIPPSLQSAGGCGDYYGSNTENSGRTDEDVVVESILDAASSGDEERDDSVLSEGTDSLTPFWVGIGRLLDHHNTARNGISAKFTIISDANNLPHPFRGVKSGYSSGNRLRIKVCTDSFVPVPVYEGDGMMAYWNEDFGGCHFSVKFDDGPDGIRENPFQAYRFGKGDGDLFAIALWLIDDQEEVIKPKKSFADISPTQQSQILCKSDLSFQVWVIKLAKKHGFSADSNALAAENAGNAVKFLCDVKSRAELSKDSFAKAKWSELLGQFRAHTGKQF